MRSNKKWHLPEEVVAKLKQADEALAKGTPTRPQFAYCAASLNPRSLGLQRGHTSSGTEPRRGRALLGIGAPIASARTFATAIDVGIEPIAMTNSLADDPEGRPVEILIESATGSAGTSSAAANGDAPSDLPSNLRDADAGIRIQRPDLVSKYSVSSIRHCSSSTQSCIDSREMRTLSTSKPWASPARSDSNCSLSLTTYRELRPK